MRLREVIFGIVARLPQRLRHWLYAQDWLRTHLAPILKHSVPADGAVVVTVATGPLRGMKLSIDRNTPNYYWLDDRYEVEAIAMLHEYAKPASVVADIGAHIGFDTLVLSRLVGESGTVLSFEPDATNLTQLQRNLKINSIRNVRVIDRAVSKSTGTCYFDAQGLTTSCLLSAKRSERTMRVQTVSLDNFFYDEHAPIPSFLKIDVEGHELAVLQGGERFLRQIKPALLLEMHAEQSMLDCLRLLMPIGYKFTLLEKRDYDLVAALEGKSIFKFFICHVACSV
jgi:FkbM family methyltransferase